MGARTAPRFLRALGQSFHATGIPLRSTSCARPKSPAASGSPVALFRAANRLVRPLLASRLHGVLSRFLMLLTCTGRKSGRRITIPVGYFDREPGAVLAMQPSS